jgi:di/tricarboxylate transporter
MTLPQIETLVLLALALVLFASGRLRHDLVALLVLFAALALGLVPFGEAFAGFGHPAVITVAAALVVSRAIAATGILDNLAGRLAAKARNPFLLIVLLGIPAALASSVMNNVAALALMMPVAIAVCRSAHASPSLTLMPLSFISMLGGLITLIGTPPNVIIATVRADRLGEAFHLFDFAPVGLAVSAGGIAFIALIGWRLVPQRIAAGKGAGHEGVQEYLLEARVGEESPLAGKPLRETSAQLDEHDATLLGLKRGEVTIPSAAQWTPVRAGDTLLIEASPDDVGELLEPLGLSLFKPDNEVIEDTRAGELRLMEAVVRPYGLAEGLTPAEVRLRQRYMVNLLGVAREGVRRFSGLKNWRFSAGDVLLLQGEGDRVDDAVGRLGLLPLATRELGLGPRPGAVFVIAIVAAALAALAFGLAPAAVCLAGAATLLMVTRRIGLREAYDAVDGSVLVLLGAMIPVGDAFDKTGTTKLIADTLVGLSGNLQPIWILALLLLVTMLLTDIVNNAATALLMAPLGIDIAQRLKANPDTFLMIVAVGASCAFLTPIGHQNNLLVMGPGGYRFSDYWRLGLPLEIFIFIATLLLVPMIWPLSS